MTNLLGYYRWLRDKILGIIEILKLLATPQKYFKSPKNLFGAHLPILAPIYHSSSSYGEKSYFSDTLGQNLDLSKYSWQNK